jgi:hypothetical protein
LKMVHGPVKLTSRTSSSKILLQEQINKVEFSETQ